VITGPSRTRGCVNPGSAACSAASFTGGTDPLSPTLQGKFFVHSRAGNATAAVLVGQAPGPSDVLDIVSSGSFADVVCDPVTEQLTVAGNGEVNALVIAGNVVPIPGPVNPNTTIAAPQLPLLVLNEQFCPDPTAPPGTKRCIVNAAHAQLITASEVLDLKLSGSTASLTNCPCCDIIDCAPSVDGTKSSLIVQQDRQTPKPVQNPQPGDPIRFTISAVNRAVANTACPAGSQVGHTLTIIDRIPLGVTVDTSSITIQTDDGPPVSATGTIADCGGALRFPGCSPEPETDADRDCLTVVAGDINPQQTKAISFVATVNAVGSPDLPCDENGVGQGICNTALIQIDETGATPSGTPRTSRILCPLGPRADRLITTGSGGCSLGGNTDLTKSELWPVVFLGALLWLRRQRRKRSSRA
ncbi:MAG: hypothetical protein ACREQQ_10520, partial [Candidatus Binatia bacterium]